MGRAQIGLISLHSEELPTLSGGIIPKGNWVEAHINLSFGQRKFTLIGLTILKTTEGYKIKGDEIRGLFEIDLNK